MEYLPGLLIRLWSSVRMCESLPTYCCDSDPTYVFMSQLRRLYPERYFGIIEGRVFAVLIFFCPPLGTPYLLIGYVAEKTRALCAASE